MFPEASLSLRTSENAKKSSASMIKALQTGSFHQHQLVDLSPASPYVLPASLSAYSRFLRSKNGRYTIEAEGWNG